MPTICMMCEPCTVFPLFRIEIRIQTNANMRRFSANLRAISRHAFHVFRIECNLCLGVYDILHSFSHSGGLCATLCATLLEMFVHWRILLNKYSILSAQGQAECKNVHMCMFFTIFLHYFTLNLGLIPMQIYKAFQCESAGNLWANFCTYFVLNIISQSILVPNQSKY